MSIASMTGYGVGESDGEGFHYQCEIRTLNSRFIEVNTRMPRGLIALEPEIIKTVKNHLARGKVDVFIDVSKTGEAKDLPQLDPAAINHYLGLFEQLQKQMQGNVSYSFASLRDPSATEIFRLEGVLKNQSSLMSPEDQINLHGAPIKEALVKALEQVKSARLKEGMVLKAALQDLLGLLEKDCAAISEKVQDLRQLVYDTYTRRLENVLKSLENTGSDSLKPPEDRLLAEIAILTDKADVEEELVRFKGHHEEFLKLMDQGDKVGRKLDFLCQEMHREVNTLSSKLQSSDVSPHSLNMKQSVERVRQQIQNIE